MKNSWQAPQGMPVPPPEGGASRKAISRRTEVCPLCRYMFSPATRSAHRSITPQQLSMQKPVKMRPSALSSAQTTWRA
ncbi:hypothetical protein [uncultured Subdoligranulum sp.]|uniref:hypothetical protein n=1 Tax=uncultured Subdoligranulum sp. TaxID=512298 RepID=UPI002603152E|nr:hypothetical protein [uncultured Subdoligranulum sp.]